MKVGQSETWGLTGVPAEDSKFPYESRATRQYGPFFFVTHSPRIFNNLRFREVIGDRVLWGAISVDSFFKLARLPLGA